ncbi:ATP-binding protein [Parapedobacter sp. GCM10030251]|uniref:ATP-binding protein n=1 Tax=Parapedobacter sp. GCM10030251 TaxID=3273419 RepID=UPI003615E917
MKKFTHLDIQQIHNLNGMAVLAIDADGMITYANTAANDLLRRERAQLVGQSLFLFFGGAFASGQTNQKKLLAGKPVSNMELTFQGPLGEERWLLLSSQMIVDMNGLAQTYLFIQDISALKKTESVRNGSGRIICTTQFTEDVTRQKELEEKMHRYTSNVEILNTMGKLVSESLDIGEILQRVTDVSTKVTGAAFGAFFYNRLDGHGTSNTLFTYSGVLPEVAEKIGTSHNSDLFSPNFSLEETVRSADITNDPRFECNRSHGVAKGQLPLVSYLAVPVISKLGRVIGRLSYGHSEIDRFTEEHEKLVVGIANQASVALENAELYEEIRYLNAKKDEFIGLASHELKTPVTSLKGFLQIISKRMTDQDINKPFVDKALNQTNKLSALIGDLLDVTKIESGQLPLSYSSFDLVSLVRDLVEQIQYSIRSHYIAFYSKKASFMISGDKQRLEQVIVNLLNNAIKYSPGADLVNVSLSGDAGQAIVRIQDFGIGIAPEQQERIFSRFYRAEGLDAHISGLGIGLYISKEIISRHKGKLTVESGIGTGSVFVVEIPV